VLLPLGLLTVLLPLALLGLTDYWCYSLGQLLRLIPEWLQYRRLCCSHLVPENILLPSVVVEWLSQGRNYLAALEKASREVRRDENQPADPDRLPLLQRGVLSF
jgi:hypothetical protein